jgi:hypothetical protein
METFSAALQLVPHPDSLPAAIGSVTCLVSWRGAGLWCFDYIIGEPQTALRMPAPVEPARSYGLWERTCFELFLRQPDDERYYEFNFSPSGEWAAFGFDSYRSGMTEVAVAQPLITSTDRRQFELAMGRHLTDLGMDQELASSFAAMKESASSEPARNYALSASLEDPGFGASGSWVAGISAIIEEADGTKSHWALAHPPGEPDFHHPDCFVLDLPPPASA